MDPARLFDVSGKHVLVSGGSRGIGELIVRGLVGAGATVYLSSRKASACEELAAELGEHAHAVPADVSTGDGCRALADAVAAHTDRLDVLVNNAGATWGAAIEDYPDEAWEKVLGLNVAGPFRLTQACLPLLRAAATADDPARVINIGSVDGIQIPAFESYAYSSSKAAVHHLTRHLGQRLAREHITVNAIAPGLFESKMTKFIFEAGGEDLEQSMPLGRTGRQDDIVGAVVYLASPASAWVTGVVLPVDGGFATLR